MLHFNFYRMYEGIKEPNNDKWIGPFDDIDIRVGLEAIFNRSGIKIGKCELIDGEWECEIVETKNSQ